MKRSSNVWHAMPEYRGIIILDPDGWDRKNFTKSWAEEITQAEFEKRLVFSTIIPSKS